ncbi:response regulator transcription factor [Pseudonocardia oroxyli]|nr:response regulator transcription factor [Pseudonocardia oroxyli]
MTLAPAVACIQVLAISPQPLMRQGLSQLGRNSYSIEVVRTAATVDDALHLVAANRPDVVVVDLPHRAVTVTERDELDQLISRALSVVVLAVPLPKVQIAQLLRLGLSGILSRNAELHDIQAAISAVSHGSTVCNIDRVRGDVEMVPPLPRLTARESQVLRLAVLGRTNKEIALELHIGETTAKFHVANLIKKCGVTRRIELAYWAGTRRFLLGGPPSS